MGGGRGVEVPGRRIEWKRRREWGRGCGWARWVFIFEDMFAIDSVGVVLVGRCLDTGEEYDRLSVVIERVWRINHTIQSLNNALHPRRPNQAYNIADNSSRRSSPLEAAYTIASSLSIDPGPVMRDDTPWQLSFLEECHPHHLLLVTAANSQAMHSRNSHPLYPQSTKSRSRHVHHKTAHSTSKYPST